MSNEKSGENGLWERVQSVMSDAVREQTDRILENVDATQSQIESLQSDVTDVQTQVEALGEGRNKDHVDIVQAGADNTGLKPIDDVLDEVAAKETVVDFPPGRYRLDQFETSLAGLELQGQNATLLPTTRSEPITPWLTAAGDGCIVDGFEIDFRECKYPPVVRIEGAGWEVKNVVVRGSMGLPETPTDDLAARGRGYSFVFAPTDGTGLVQDFYAPDGAADPDGAGNRFGFVYNGGGRIQGDLIYDRCWFSGWPNNTIYHHNMAGHLYVRNSYFYNTDGCLRCGGGTDVVNSVFLKDGWVPPQRWWNAEQGTTDAEEMVAKMRGPWTTGADKDYGEGTVRIEGCDIRLAAGGHPNHVGRGVRADPAPDRLEVIDTRIDVESEDCECILVDGDSTVVLEDVDLRQRGDAVAFRDGAGASYERVEGVVAAGGVEVVDGDAVASALDDDEGSAPNVDPPLPEPPAVGRTP